MAVTVLQQKRAGVAQELLIIEDDRRLAEMLAEYLAGFGLNLRVAGTIEEGWRALDRGVYAAVILDVMLPDGDGLQVCRDLRARSDVPIVMLTARGEETDRILGLELGADDYLPKPFNPRELLARLRAVMRRRGGGEAAGGQLRFGRLSIDPASRQVRLDGRACELTGYQFDLLLALARHAGRVMSRDALMDALRGSALEAYDRSIDVHVSRIRAQIEDDPRRPRRIITVRGAGYVFALDPDST